MSSGARAFAIAALAMLCHCHTAFVALAQDHTPDKAAVTRHVGQAAVLALRRAQLPDPRFLGDTHLHTAVSVDAGTMSRLGQEDAFRFARGEEVTATGGLRAKLSRPLDFLVIADHAEMYGLMPQLLSGDPEVLSTETGKKWYDAVDQRRQRTRSSPRRWRSWLAVGRRASDQERQGGPQRLAGLHCAGRQIQRARPLHRPHRLRMDGDRRLQPAPQRDFPRQCQRRQPHGAVLAVRQQEPRGPLGHLAAFEERDRRRSARHSPQRQSQQRPHVHGRDFRRQAAHHGAGSAARRLRAARRGHTDQGRRRGASLPLAERRVRRL